MTFGQMCCRRRLRDGELIGGGKAFHGDIIRSSRQIGRRNSDDLNYLNVLNGLNAAKFYFCLDSQIFMIHF